MAAGSKFDLLSSRVIGCAVEVHRHLGPGLLESVYRECLAYECVRAGLNIEVERSIGVRYKDVHLECGFRIDIVVERELVVEIKAVETVLPIHLAQLLTYLRLSAMEIGLLLNFNSRSMRHGIRRVVC
jgi:GxxExxY protein